MRSLFTAIIACSLCLSNFLIGDDSAIPELMPLQAQYAAKVNHEILEPFKTDLVNLLASYRSIVSHALEAAQESNKIEDIVALKAEKALVDSGKAPPQIDGPNTVRTLKNLRNTYRLEAAHLDRARDQKWQPIRDEYARSLTSLVEALTRRGKIEDALAVRDIIDRMKSLSLCLVGKWNIEHCGDVKAVWTFNKNNTYNYWNETGKYAFKDGHFFLKHTWNWEIRIVDDDTFEGVCTKGQVGCVIHGNRIKQ